jgi:hypothetical protein
MPDPGEFEPASGIRSETPSRCADQLPPRAPPSAEKARRRSLRTTLPARRHTAMTPGDGRDMHGRRCITRAKRLAPPWVRRGNVQGGAGRPVGQARRARPGTGRRPRLRQAIGARRPDGTFRKEKPTGPRWRCCEGRGGEEPPRHGRTRRCRAMQSIVAYNLPIRVTSTTTGKPTASSTHNSERTLTAQGNVRKVPALRRRAAARLRHSSGQICQGAVAARSRR